LDGSTPRSQTLRQTATIGGRERSLIGHFAGHRSPAGCKAAQEWVAQARKAKWRRETAGKELIIDGLLEKPPFIFSFR
jgi:hypothetical protein